MRNRDEILLQVDYYKNKLAIAIEERNYFEDFHCTTDSEYAENLYSPDLDLLIITLVDKLEALLWVLDVDLQSPDHIDRLLQIYH